MTRMRTLLALVLLNCIVGPVAAGPSAQEQSRCRQVWSLAGIYPGMSTQELAALFSNPDVRQLSGRKTISLPDSLLRTGGSPSVHELEACVDPVEGVIWVQGVIVPEGGQENIEKQLVDRLKTSHRFPFGCTDGALGDESFGTCEVV